MAQDRLEGAGRPRPLVVGVAHDPASAAALAFARRLGSSLGAPVRVVHAVDLDDYPVDPDAGTWDPDAPPASWHVVRGDPAAAIAAEAERVDASMIVVGAPARGVGRFGRRSVARRLVEQVTRPVVVVPLPAGLAPGPSAAQAGAGTGSGTGLGVGGS